jgi:uncharacterized membrane protein HdeD (DUF308 family)
MLPFRGALSDSFGRRPASLVALMVWGWMLASGIADLALAAIILVSWPMSAGWALGIIAGVNLITSGWAIIMVAPAGHELANAAA